MALLLTTDTADMTVKIVYQVPISSAPLGSGLRDTLTSGSAYAQRKIAEL